ncbi:MAG: DUF547 domain-containing protein [Candidatus Obscuribacterales bacterium]|nr:DUF547 domain-containing protein [Candidatus Obscuribacterales bacterium]
MNRTATDNTAAYCRNHREQRRHFAWSLLLMPLMIFFAIMPSSAAVKFDHEHKLFSEELKKYVRPDGVRYKAWIKDRAKFNQYLDELRAVTAQDYTGFSDLEKKALWLNTYNALALKLVMDNYPIQGNNSDYPANSMRQIPDCWKAVRWNVAGRDVDLFTLKHKILRSEIQDYRTHFSVVPASMGGPRLAAKAFAPDDINERLTTNMKTYLTNPEHLQFAPDQNTIKVSRIFRWFLLDFVKRDADGKAVFPPPSDDEIVQEFSMQFAPESVRKQFDGKKAKVEYLPYDWTLNESTEP